LTVRLWPAAAMVRTVAAASSSAASEMSSEYAKAVFSPATARTPTPWSMPKLAALHDAFFEAPAFAARVLEVEVGVVDAVVAMACRAFESVASVRPKGSSSSERATASRSRVGFARDHGGGSCGVVGHSRSVLGLGRAEGFLELRWRDGYSGKGRRVRRVNHHWAHLPGDLLDRAKVIDSEEGRATPRIKEEKGKGSAEEDGKAATRRQVRRSTTPRLWSPRLYETASKGKAKVPVVSEEHSKPGALCRGS